jgi:hypothetical protein
MVKIGKKLVKHILGEARRYEGVTARTIGIAFHLDYLPNVSLRDLLKKGKNSTVASASHQAAA